MITNYQSAVLEAADAWEELRLRLDPDKESECLDGILRAFRDAGGRYYILEDAYLDRDYVRAYASFYHRVYSGPGKFCRRLHVFRQNLQHIEHLPPGKLAEALEAASEDYLGFLILRPVDGAPVSWAVVRPQFGPGDFGELLVRAEYPVHLLGAELKVTGAAITEQDRRTGSCAQAAIWGVARHFHKKYAGPWLSVVDVTTAALTPTDEDVAAMLPAGSRRLTTDAMVRALKALSYQPLVYRPNRNGEWFEPAHRIIGRHLDSGIPVIVGLDDGVGAHAVLAVGRSGHSAPLAAAPEGEAPAQQLEDATVPEVAAASDDDPDGDVDGAPEVPVPIDEPSGSQGNDAPSKVSADKGGRGEPDQQELDLGPNIWDYATDILVNDDQRGPYRRLALDKKNRAEGGYKHTLEDVTFILPVLPETVFMPAEGAETVARRTLAFMIKSWRSRRRKSEKDKVFEPGAEFVSRTYLTHGWKHATRMLRNDVPDELKEALLGIGLPRWVWVTEFSLAEDFETGALGERRVAAHVVVDPTSSHFLDAVDCTIMGHAPGYLLTVAYDQDRPGTRPEIALKPILPQPSRYYPKVRGCEARASKVLVVSPPLEDSRMNKPE